MRCGYCRVTHALIPSFSLPGTSIGTEEAEAYLAARARGESRGKAGKTSGELGLSEGYPKHLERMVAASVQIGKALLVGMGDQRLSGLAWIASVCAQVDRPLYRINCFGLEHQVNGLCFCRRWLLHYRRTAVVGQASHNLGSAAEGTTPVDSG